MYSKQESSRLRESFWTAFGQYMTLHSSSDGEKINWVNYKTGIKNLQFRMRTDNFSASIAIEISDVDSRKKYFHQFLLSKTLLGQFLAEDWNWEPEVMDENNKLVSRISTTLQGVSIYHKQDWPEIISFLKPRLIALDEFWNLCKYSFENL